MGGHCVCCKDGDAANETRNRERWALPEGQEGLSRQIFQAFQLHPEGREMYLSFLRRHVSIPFVHTGMLALLPPAVPLPTCFLISSTLQVPDFPECLPCLCLAKLLHPSQPQPSWWALSPLIGTADQPVFPNLGGVHCLMGFSGAASASSPLSPSFTHPL